MTAMPTCACGRKLHRLDAKQCRECWKKRGADGSTEKPLCRVCGVNRVSRNGTTIADMANGPRQRIQPYPDTVALLEMLGSKNNHKCVSC